MKPYVARVLILPVTLALARVAAVLSLGLLAMEQTEAFATAKPVPGSPPVSTPTCVPGSSDYVVTVSQGSIVPGTDMIPGSRCNNCVPTVALPFPFRLYDRKFASA